MKIEHTNRNMYAKRTLKLQYIGEKGELAAFLGADRFWHGTCFMKGSARIGCINGYTEGQLKLKN
jgi:hypothetical protein